LQGQLERIDGLSRAFNFNRHSDTVVENEADQIVTKRLGINEGTKTDPLDNTLNEYTLSLQKGFV
jgi:hypothetical protein